MNQTDELFSLVFKVCHQIAVKCPNLTLRMVPSGTIFDMKFVSTLHRLLNEKKRHGSDAKPE